jgi:hypothetical protein
MGVIRVSPEMSVNRWTQDQAYDGITFLKGLIVSFAYTPEVT